MFCLSILTKDIQNANQGKLSKRSLMYFLLGNIFDFFNDLKS